MPGLTYFTIEDLLAHRLSEGISQSLVVLVFVGALVLRRVLPSPVLPARIVVICGLVVLTWDLSIGAGGGFAALWFFPYPLFAFSLLGRNEGGILVAVSIAVFAFFALGWPESRVHYEATGVRLLVAYGVMAALAWTMESSRYRYDRSLTRKHHDLLWAWDHVHQLEGLLPICAWCKKIRDDEGYWSEVEAYLGRQVSVEFTHSICPTCAAASLEEFRQSQTQSPEASSSPPPS